MKQIISTVVLLMLTVSMVFASAFPRDTRVVGVVFDPGEDTINIADETKTDAPVMYRFRATQGQSLSVALSTESEKADFKLYAPGKWPGIVIHDSGAGDGLHFKGKIEQDGAYAVVVSPSTKGKNQGASAKFDLMITLKSAP